jgi:hypothetical protein
VLWSNGFCLKGWRFPLCRRHGACLIVTSHLSYNHIDRICDLTGWKTLSDWCVHVLCSAKGTCLWGIQ